MSILESSWILEERLKNIKCSSELKEEISNFIEVCTQKENGYMLPISNYSYRINLHYIEDNISNPDLLKELKNAINKINFTDFKK